MGLLHYSRREQTMVTLYTFGDSILDCARYNELGVHPGQLLVQNDDRLFPEFQGQDLQSRGIARLEHRARDGATVTGLQSQAQGLHVEGRALALITQSLLEPLGCLTRCFLHNFRLVIKSDMILCRHPVQVFLGCGKTSKEPTCPIWNQSRIRVDDQSRSLNLFARINRIELQERLKKHYRRTIHPTRTAPSRCPIVVISFLTGHRHIQIVLFNVRQVIHLPSRLILNPSRFSHLQTRLVIFTQPQLGRERRESVVRLKD